MPTCNSCGISRTRLNGNLCKSCFTQQGTVNVIVSGNELSEDLLTGDYLNKPIVELNVGDLISIIKLVSADNEKNIAAITSKVLTLEQRVETLEKENDLKDTIILN